MQVSSVRKCICFLNMTKDVFFLLFFYLGRDIAALVAVGALKRTPTFEMRNDFPGQQLHRTVNEFRLHSTKVQPEHEVSAIHVGLVPLNEPAKVVRCTKPELLALFQLSHDLRKMPGSIVMLVNHIPLQGIYGLLPRLRSRWSNICIKISGSSYFSASPPAS